MFIDTDAFKTVDKTELNYAIFPFNAYGEIPYNFGWLKGMLSPLFLVRDHATSGKETSVLVF